MATPEVLHYIRYVLKNIDRGTVNFPAYHYMSLLVNMNNAWKDDRIQLLDGTYLTGNEIACKSLESNKGENQDFYHHHLGCVVKKTYKVLGQPDVKVSLRDYLWGKALILENGDFNPNMKLADYLNVLRYMEGDDDYIDLGNGKVITKEDLERYCEERKNQN